LVNRKAERKRKIDDKKRRLFSLLQDSECAHCGEDDPLVLEFDHLHEKRADISALIRSSCPWRTVLRELEKCDVVCANCHRRKTNIEANSYRYRMLLSA